MGIVCGADGCRAGWFCVFKDLSTGLISCRVCATVHDLADAEPMVEVIAVDIPIGLPESGPRLCDLEARRFLGRERGSSIFPAPIRPVLAAADYEEACRIRLRVEGKRLSRQSWGIVPKIREMDEFLRRHPAFRARVREVHPEVSFCFMAGGQPLRYSKKKPGGREERRRLLKPFFGKTLNEARADRIKSAVAEDDVLDAFAAVWTAERIAGGIAETFPSAPPHDRFGLPMQIVA